MPVERRGQVIALKSGQPATGGTRYSTGRRQPSRGGTSRMTRECQVRICERLGVQFPGPTRQFPGPTRPTRKKLSARVNSGYWFIGRLSADETARAHVFDHALAQWTDGLLAHRGAPVLRWRFWTPSILKTGHRSVTASDL